MFELSSVWIILSIISVIYGQDYDCDQAPPISVEPLTCCKISKPFDRKNFPECFIDPLYIITTTESPSTSYQPIIPVTEIIVDDDEYTFGNNNNYNNNNRGGYYNRQNNGGGYANKKRVNKNKGGDRGGDDGSNKRDGNDDDQNNDGGGGHWKHHWGGFGHHHHHDHDGYHRFGFHGRHRRQAVFQPSNLRNQCAIECIFNQTNILTNGRFDRDIALEVYADYYPEVPIDLLTRTIDKCSKQLRNYRLGNRRRIRNKNYNNLPNRRCRNGSGLFATCFNREIYRNCPVELDNDSDDCISLRTFIDNCSPIRGTREIGGIANVDVDEYGNIILDDQLN